MSTPARRSRGRPRRTGASTPGWSGQAVTEARARWVKRLPRPCWHCRLPVLPTQRWVVEHIVPRALGGNPTDPSNQWVSHRSCSDKSGGKVKAALNRARRPAPEDSAPLMQEGERLQW